VGERTEYAPGAFSWVELSSPDAEASKAFYTAVFGWRFTDTPVPGGGGTYTMFTQGGLEVAGLHQPSPDRAGPPAWLSYVTVESADAAASRAAELGASVLAGPFDVGDAGRMAVVQDPQGAVFGVWQAGESIGARLVNDPGSLTMNQLNAADPDAAANFYTALFGWRVERVSEEPPYWSMLNGETLNAGLMPLPPGAPAPPHWLAYFTVSGLEESAGRVTAGGGTVLVPPTEIPAGRFLVAADPQGAVFALFEGEVDP
jgi:predicted enzyme related to lactoylglutathione lyase